MRRPLLALWVAQMAGICCADRLALDRGWFFLALTACSLVALWARVRGLGGPLRFFAWWLACFFAGAFCLPVAAPTQATPFTDEVVLHGRVVTVWERLSSGWRFDLEPLGARPLAPRDPSRLPPIQGRIQVRIRPGPDEQDRHCQPGLPGDVIWLRGRLSPFSAYRNPGLPDRQKRMARRGMHWTLGVNRCRNAWLEPELAESSVLRWAERLRRQVRAFLECEPGSKRGKQLLAALTIGDSGQVSEAFRAQFIASGLAHLLAISGLHVGFVALGWYGLLLASLLRWPWLVIRLDVRRLAAAATVPLVLAYVLLAGARPPTVRAGIVVACFLIAVFIRRRADPLQTLAAAGMIVLGLWPYALFEASYQLSFAATLGVILLTPLLLRLTGLQPGAQQPWFRHLAIRILQGVLVSLAATAATTPLVAWHFNRLACLGLLANLLAVPLAAWLVVPVGLTAVALCLFFPALAGLTFQIGFFLADGLGQLAEWWSSWTWSSVWLATPSGVALMAWYGCLVAVPRIRSFRRLGWLVASVVLVPLAWFAVSGWLGGERQGLRVTFLDVGHGDSSLIEFPGGQNLLIDGGARYPDGFDVGRSVVAPFLWHRGIRRLDVIACTHDHPDHAGGLVSLIRVFGPRELWLGTDPNSDPLGRELVRAANEVGARIRLLRAGDRPDAGVLRDEVQVDVLWPDAAAVDLSENERSLVFRLRFGQLTMLFAGDLEREGERRLLQLASTRGWSLRADVLKVGHHGSRQATGVPWLDAVQPRLAVISARESAHMRLPSPVLLQRLAERRVPWFRTDRCGAIRIRTDGHDIRVETHVDCQGPIAQ